MNALVIAEHDNNALKGATLNALAAARELGGDVVDPEVVGDHVVIGVRGHHDGLVQVDDAVAAGSGVAELVSAEHEIAGVADRLRRRALAQFERGERHVRLERRSRRIHAGERAVVERPVG